VERQLPEILEQASQWGYDAVECWVHHVSSLGNEARAAVLGQMKDLDLRIPMISPYFNFTTSDETANESMQRAREAILLAREMGIPLIRVFTGKTRSADATEDQWRRAADCLQTLCDESKADGIGWAAETHDWNLMDTVAGTQQLLERVNRSNFGIIYQATTFGPDYMSALASLGESVFHVHATSRKGDKGSPLPSGEIDYAAIASELDRRSYSGYFSVEWMGDDPEAVLTSSLAYLRNIEQLRA